MAELERQGHETILFVSEAVHAQSAADDGKTGPGVHDIVRRELMRVSDGQPQRILAGTQGQMREAALDGAPVRNGFR